MESEKKDARTDINEEENAKKTALVSAVIFFMLLIGFFWIMDLKRTFKQKNAEVASQANSSSSFEELKKDFKENFIEIKAGLLELQESYKNQKSQLASSSPQSNQAALSQLKEKLKPAN